MPVFSCPILILGDVMLDTYIASSVSRLSPEAPVPVARVEKQWSVPGGAANVARNLAALGYRVALAGVCGTDEAGNELLTLLGGAHVESCLVRADGRPTTCKARVTSQGQQLIRLDRETASIVPPETTERLWDAISTRLAGFSAVILSDYNKGLLRSGHPEPLAQRVIGACARYGIPVLVDPKGTDWSLYAGSACITPNVKELAAAAALEDVGDAALCEGVRTLMRRFRFPRVLLTRSEKGVALFDGDAPPLSIPSEVREVADVSGAGDTVIAVLAAGVAAGMDWAEAARAANIAAGVVVGKPGTSPITRAELHGALAAAGRHDALADLDARIFSLPRLMDALSRWRKAGQRVVFTNGCFDLLHLGHVRLIREAAAQGDRLVVALNSDSSVRRLKGAGRPIQKEAARAAVMAALDGVDAVILFDEDTPQRLIETLTPDVLVKGGDYSEDTVVGAAHVLSHGGRVHIVRTVEGYSTTGIVSIING